MSQDDVQTQIDRLVQDVTTIEISIERLAEEVRETDA